MLGGSIATGLFDELEILQCLGDSIFVQIFDVLPGDASFGVVISHNPNFVALFVYVHKVIRIAAQPFNVHFLDHVSDLCLPFHLILPIGPAAAAAAPMSLKRKTFCRIEPIFLKGSVQVE